VGQPGEAETTVRIVGLLSLFSLFLDLTKEQGPNSGPPLRDRSCGPYRCPAHYLGWFTFPSDYSFLPRISVHISRHSNQCFLIRSATAGVDVLRKVANELRNYAEWQPDRPFFLVLPPRQSRLMELIPSDSFTESLIYFPLQALPLLLRGSVSSVLLGAYDRSSR